ncbi:MAG TPA: glycosyltransferase, partial [Solirubrobacterales bacterium]|nr:glycosyltransferase [Solirubrobacterales bacterium]
GHVVPAIEVADALRAEGADVRFAGGERAEAELVPAAGYEIEFLSVSGLDRRNPLKAARSAIGAVAAMRQARRALRSREADVVLGGGGFVVGPAGVAARSLGLPLVLTEADRHLGLANRLLAGRAAAVCLAYPIPGREGAEYRVTGRAVPRTVTAAGRDAARRRFGIAPGRATLLVMGGSQGARSINLAASEAFGGDLVRGFHVVHLAGSRDYPELLERLSGGAAREYTLLEYEADLGDCLAACDLVLARAGGSIFEMMAVGRPAILVPYPYATGDHQAANAEWMVEGGAATVIADAELDAAGVREQVGDLLGDPARLAAMAAASRALARPDAAATIADVALEAYR